MSSNKPRQSRAPINRSGLSPSDHIQVAILNEQMGEVKQDIKEMENSIKELTKKIAEINDLGARWKGVFFLFLTVSSILSALITSGKTLWGYLH